MPVQRTFSKAPWEKMVGYCRAIRVGNTIAVTGTAAVDEDGQVFAPGQPYEQTQRCLALAEFRTGSWRVFRRLPTRDHDGRSQSTD